MSVTARLWRGSEGAEVGLEVAAGEVIGTGSTAVRAGDPGAVWSFPEGSHSPVAAGFHGIARRAAGALAAAALRGAVRLPAISTEGE